MDDDNDEEVQGLILPSGKKNRFSTMKPECNKASFSSSECCVPSKVCKKERRFAMTPLVLVAAAISVLLVFLLSAPRHLLDPVDQTSHKTDNASSFVPETNKGNNGRIISYSCPQQIGTILDFDARDYEEKAKEIPDNMTVYLDTLRNGGTFDNWGYSYNEVKAQMSPFKKKYYALFLSKPNATLYESAAGVGLNLFMTLELLEQQEVTGVTIYGNEYVEASTIKANALFDHMVPGKGYKGMICQADSTKLDQFVPAESFDVVFTGYIRYRKRAGSRELWTVYVGCFSLTCSFLGWVFLLSLLVHYSTHSTLILVKTI
jgi:hypothetical protein